MACRVTYEGKRYQIESDGTVRRVPMGPLEIPMTAQALRMILDRVPPVDEPTAEVIRREWLQDFMEENNLMYKKLPLSGHLSIDALEEGIMYYPCRGGECDLDAPCHRHSRANEIAQYIKARYDKKDGKS